MTWRAMSIRPKFEDGELTFKHNFVGTKVGRGQSLVPGLFVVQKLICITV